MPTDENSEDPTAVVERRRFGQFPDLEISDDFDAPMGEEELALWES